MASVAKGIFGGELPWTMIGIGAGIGAAIIALDEFLKSRNIRFRTPVLACAVGIYLPIELTVPIFAGGLLTHIVERVLKPGDAAGERERIHQKGTLFAAGLITGEALMGIFIAIPIVVLGSADALALPESLRFSGWLGLLMLAGVAFLMYRIAVRPQVE
jgi:putative OPT family oligopeptide transporter